MSGHTPAPWRVIGEEVYAEQSGMIVTVADLALVPNEWGDVDANGCLIAAAPDLLAVCDRLIHATHFRHERLGDGGVNIDFHEETLLPILDACRAAIARATGEVRS